MNNENQSPLERLQDLQRLLKEAIQYGYEVSYKEDSLFGFSPIQILLDSLIDILIITGKMFDLGAQGPMKNPGLMFSEREQDVLGNPKQIRINFPRDYYWDPKAQEIFLQLAAAFVEIKGRKSVRQSFHDFAERIDLLKSSRAPSSARKNKSKAKYWYWRRHKKS